MSAELYGRKLPDVLTHPDRMIQEVAAWCMRTYLRSYHQLETNLSPQLSPKGPYFALTSHFSILDVAALIAIDPYYPRTAFVVKEEMIGVPIMSTLLKIFNAASVARDGHGIGAIRKIRTIYNKGNGICIAAGGTRSRTGRLTPLDSSLVKLAQDTAKRGIPVFPIVEIGTFEALPPGTKKPKPHKITVVAGEPIDLSSGLDDTLTAASLIQSSLIELLPERYHPKPGDRLIWNSREYVPNR